MIDMKRVTLLLAMCLCFGIAFPLSYFRTIDGKRIFGNIKQETDSFYMVEIEETERVIRINKSDLVLVEHEENGLFIYREDLLNPVNPETATTPFYASTNGIYIPISSSKIAQRSGSATLKMLLLGNDSWNIVDTEEEAHYILSYVFDDRGADKAYLKVENRLGKVIYTSQPVPARDWVPWHAGEESATLLHKIIMKKIKKNKL